MAQKAVANAIDLSLFTPWAKPERTGSAMIRFNDFAVPVAVGESLRSKATGDKIRAEAVQNAAVDVVT